jgi:hypothetical protein
VDVLACVAVEVLADQRCLVAPAVEHGRERRPVVEGLEPERVDVAEHVVVVGVLAVRNEARLGQHSGYGANEFSKARPRPLISLRTLGMNLSSSQRMSSVSMTSMFGRLTDGT